MKAVRESEASAVVSGINLPSPVSRAPESQEEVWAHFLAVLQELPHVLSRARRVAAEQRGTRMAVNQRMRIPNMLAIHTEASLHFRGLERPLFFDWENRRSSDRESLSSSDLGKQLFVDQGMDMGFAKDCLVSFAEMADDHRDMEEKGVDNEPMPKWQSCVDCRSRAQEMQWILACVF